MTGLSTHSQFFLVVPPGLEKVALYELHRFFLHVFKTSLDHYELFPGGIEVSLPLSQGLQLNYLKVPTRCLLRLGTQLITSEAEYVEFLKSQNWSHFKSYRRIYVSSRTSELRFKDDLERIFKKTVKIPKTEKGADVYIRFFRDQCTLSVDTSGDDLYVRGYDKWVGEAPLRDNIAAGLLQFSTQGIEDFSNWVLVDPVVGSGTFLLEALHMHKAYPRKFGFHQWSMAGVESVQVPEEVLTLKMNFQKVFGFDQDQKVLSLAEKNLKTFHIKNYQLAVRDALAVKPALSADGQKLVMINPPYGKRLKIRDWNFFSDLLNSVAEWTQADRIGIMVPRGNFLEHPDYEMVRSLDMLNNGIEIFFYLFLKKSFQKI